MGALLRALDGDPRPALGAELKRVRDQLGLHAHDDVIRLEVVNEVFRPLAEGLALFAEYDAVSRMRSRAWSPLPVAVSWNFAGRKRFEAQAERGFVEPFSTMMIAGELISEARLSEWAVTSKATLLREPFKSRGGGYLLGYLTVKSMWRYLYRQDDRLYGESDVVLAYLRSFFFEDAEMAAEILSPPINNCMLSTQRLLNKFNARLGEFFDATPADVSAFEAALDGGERNESAGMLRTPEQYDVHRHEVMTMRPGTMSIAEPERTGWTFSSACRMTKRSAALRRSARARCFVPSR